MIQWLRIMWNRNGQNGCVLCRFSELAKREESVWCLGGKATRGHWAEESMTQIDLNCTWIRLFFFQHKGFFIEYSTMDSSIVQNWRQSAEVLLLESQLLSCSRPAGRHCLSNVVPPPRWERTKTWPHLGERTKDVRVVGAPRLRVAIQRR